MGKLITPAYTYYFMYNKYISVCDYIDYIYINSNTFVHTPRERKHNRKFLSVCRIKKNVWSTSQYNFYSPLQFTFNVNDTSDY